MLKSREIKFEFCNSLFFSLIFIICTSVACCGTLNYQVFFMYFSKLTLKKILVETSVRQTGRLDFQFSSIGFTENRFPSGSGRGIDTMHHGLR